MKKTQMKSSPGTQTTEIRETFLSCASMDDFYSSIAEDLLSSALEFASAYDNITDDEMQIISRLRNHNCTKQNPIVQAQ